MDKASKGAQSGDEQDTTGGIQTKPRNTQGVSGIRRFSQAPVLEYRAPRIDTTKVISHQSEFGTEEAHILAEKYLAFCEENNMEPYEELRNVPTLIAIVSELLDETVACRLMNTELGQGMLLGYVWASTDWETIANEEEP